ncbi:aldose 1-epimerase [Amycolatopsis bartoniae]|uniref:Galactose mutarotase n=1 Tax=Amycolatopsis bartoniae TaxID=941986 RepID=A0A8H9M7C0_9PSEU|nr:aldose 1-epimerase family protein [Amycolatopsis bartoniae]MBB2938086.1 aldose 1-epimerase [Amycolatopsis bartoniae]TVT01246.1 aldose 1-epimerase family protein [Amycolatopsis bartoniae]GHF32575.1 galactose mutarotase [Amycolatopsis bartoniae]
MPLAPSGQQYEISSGPHHAVVVEVGGGIREYSVRDRPVLEPYALSAVADGAHGTPLIPWPNRLGDGRYRFEGAEHQLPLTEPAKGNAIHGLLRWRPWEAGDLRGDAVTMSTRLHPRPGYPFCLDVAIRYELSDQGLTVTTTAVNAGDAAAPYGYGHHPYLSPGPGRIDDAVLSFSAGTRLVTDPERQLPTGTETVAGTPYDFSSGRRIGELEIDYPFTGLARDGDGRAWVRLRGNDGATSELWVDETCPYVELFTGDSLAPARRRTGLGVEPMTCPPNAFQSRKDLVRLEPGERMTTRWGTRLT